MKRKAVWIGIVMAGMVTLSGCGDQQREEYRLAGIGQIAEGDYAGALVSFEQALEKSKGSVGAFELDVLKYRAEAEYQLEDYSAAAHTYGVLLQVDEERTEYYLYRCAARGGAGDLAGAVEDYRAAAERMKEAKDVPQKDTEAVDPAAADLMAALQNLGLIMEGQPEYRNIVMELYQQALEAGYASGAIYNRMGMISMDAEDYDGAIRLFEQGLSGEESEASKDLQFNLAVAYERKIEFAKALQLFEEYVKKYGSDDAVQKEITFLKTR